MKLPGAIGIERSEAGDKVGPGEGEVASLEQGSESRAAVLVQRCEGLREAGVDGSAQFAGHLLFGVAVVGRQVVDGGQGQKRAPRVE